MIVQSAIEQYVNTEEEYEPTGEPRLWGSDVGYCPRKAMLRVQGYPVTIDFSTDTKIRMSNGVAFEDETAKALLAVYGAERVDTQFVLSTDIWSCKVDFVIYHGTDHPVIIEHKATGDKHWNYNNSLPQPAHVAQLAIYGRLYKEVYGITPALILYYRSWGHYAELSISPDSQTYFGTMDGVPVNGDFPVDIDTLRATLENAYLADELPPILADKTAGCYFRGKPSCSMYYHCFPAIPF